MSGELAATPGSDPYSSPRRFFDLLGELSPLRVISACGPSTFEAIIRFGEHELGGRMMNAITPGYHWHFDLARFRHLRSRDQVHARSGRRVMFFELREEPAGAPFLWIYVHRERGEEFDAERERSFAAAHARLAEGVVLDAQGDA